MPDLSLAGLAVVAAAAFTVPLLLGMAPSMRLPAAVLELLAGILIGPSGLKWVTVDTPIQVVSSIGLAFVLFLGGLEIGIERLRGGIFTAALANFTISLAVALPVVYGLQAAGLIQAPLLVAIILAATSLGIILPLLKDAGHAASDLGQLIIASASIADVGTIVLLSLFFSQHSRTVGTQLILLGMFAVLATAVTLGLLRAERWVRWSSALVRLQDTTSQIRVRGAFLLLLAFVALAGELGLEVIFGAFIAGAILRLTDRDEMMIHPQFRLKLDAIGFGVFIPIFFVTSGLRFDLAALLGSRQALLLVPVFLAALLVVRGLPALVYHPRIGGRGTIVAGFLQATSLPFIVVASHVGVQLGLLTSAVGAGLVAAGLLSVLLFPAMALALLRVAQDMADNARPT